MSTLDDHRDLMSAAKRHARLTFARLAVKRAEVHVRRFPHASATPMVTDLRLALSDLISELEET
jgi:hypothetical protein